MMIDTTNDKDTKDRVAVLLFNKDNQVLLGVSPQKYKTKDNPHSWDIAGKGHIGVGDSVIESAKREVREETNLDIDLGDCNLIDIVSYQSGNMYVFAVENIDKDSDIKCNAYFDMYGKKLPEIKEFFWATLEQAKQMLYKSLCDAFDKSDIWTKVEQFLIV